MAALRAGVRRGGGGTRFLHPLTSYPQFANRLCTFSVYKMLETILLSSALALAVSAVAHFVGHWQLRVRVGRLEMILVEDQDRLMVVTQRRDLPAPVVVLAT